MKLTSWKNTIIHKEFSYIFCCLNKLHCTDLESSLQCNLIPCHLAIRAKIIDVLSSNIVTCRNKNFRAKNQVSDFKFGTTNWSILNYKVSFWTSRLLSEFLLSVDPTRWGLTLTNSVKILRQMLHDIPIGKENKFERCYRQSQMLSVAEQVSSFEVLFQFGMKI